MGEGKYNRVVLKISGEAFANPETGHNIDFDVMGRMAEEIADARAKLDIQIAVAIGGGNIFRGSAGERRGMDRARADYMGMLGMVINALALQEALEKVGQPARVQTGLSMTQVAEPYIALRAIRHLEKGRVVVFAAGIGNPYFTSDTTAALRAAEIKAEAIFKGTHSTVDGIYDADPRLHPEAKKLDHVSYIDVINRGLKVMDSTAITFCMDNHIPIVVFNVMEPGNIMRVLSGEKIGSTVSADPS